MLAHAAVCHHALVEFTSKEAFEASNDLALGPAIGGAACDVVDGRLVEPHPDDGGSIEGGLGLAVAEFAYALPRTRWNIGLTQQVGRVSLLARVNYFGGWYDYDSGFAQTYLPSGGIEQGFFAGQPIVDLEASMGLGGGTTLAVGGQNAFNTFPDESARARSVGEKYSEYTPWGFNGAYYYARIRYAWGR